jgi:catechol 2,3-dioxygenase-like lactoylglutathione lyase family enzyme
VPAPVLTEIRLSADPAAWTGAGFSVAGDTCSVGGVCLAFGAGGAGIVDWALTGVRAAAIDGLRTRAGALPQAASPAVHANGVIDIDHVVALTPDLQRTINALESEGIELRRIREGETGMGPYRQAFFRLGRPILEVVEASDMGDSDPARFWGITFTTSDIDAAAEFLGDRLGRVKDAVQPGRRIATVRKEAGLGLPVALITPKP